MRNLLLNEVHPIETLFLQLKNVRPYGEGMVEIHKPISGLGFFPGGDGLWKDPGSTLRPPMPVGGLMVLGNNFQCAKQWEAIRKAGTESRDRDPTWRNLLVLLKEAGIDESQCFFTNSFMGVIQGDNPMRTVAGMRDPGFLTRCRDFLLIQLRLVQPRAILALGNRVPRFLAPLSEQTSHWQKATKWAEIDRNDGSFVKEARFLDVEHPISIGCIVHPSLRRPNLRRRAYKGLVGADAERAILSGLTAILREQRKTAAAEL